MGIISWIVIGLLAGWLAAKITNSPRGLLRNLAVGLVGAIVGGFLAQKLGIAVVPDFWGRVDHRHSRRGAAAVRAAGDPAGVSRRVAAERAGP